MRPSLCLLACLTGFSLLVGCESTVERGAETDLAVVDARRSAGHVGGTAVDSLIDRLVRRDGFERAELERIFARVEHQPWIIDLMDRQAPAPPSGPTGAWTRYRARFVTSDNIANGVRFWRRHAEALEQAEKRYGVPPEYIVAILGVETRYGGYLGGTRIIDALATLAFDYPRRAEFFTGELESFLIMCRDEGMNPFAPEGSYAGAMGLGQFMPSSFHGFAVDFDGDGRRDLWDPVDAIGSVANYLSGHGWRRGEPVAVPADASGYRPRSIQAGFKSRYPVATLASHGVTATRPLTGHARVSLLELDAAGGYEYWLGLNNFRVITAYNRSTYYAMSVHQLAQALRRAEAAGPILSQVAGAGRAPPL